MEVLRAARVLTVGDVTLIPIERTAIQSAMGEAGVWLSGFKQACAVVVCDAGGIRALGADSAEIELAVLMQKIPALGSLLAGRGVSCSGE